MRSRPAATIPRPLASWFNRVHAPARLLRLPPRKRGVADSIIRSIRNTHEPRVQEASAGNLCLMPDNPVPPAEGGVRRSWKLGIGGRLFLGLTAVAAVILIGHTIATETTRKAVEAGARDAAHARAAGAVARARSSSGSWGSIAPYRNTCRRRASRTRTPSIARAWRSKQSMAGVFRWRSETRRHAFRLRAAAECRRAHRTRPRARRGSRAARGLGRPPQSGARERSDARGRRGRQRRAHR